MSQRKKEATGEVASEVLATRWGGEEEEEEEEEVEVVALEVGGDT